MLPWAATWSCSLCALNPSGLYRYPVWSPTAMVETPSLERMTAVCEPTLPKPCTLIVEPSSVKPRSLAHSRMQKTRP